MAAPSVKREDEVGDWRIQSPCRIELIGPSGTGKSSVLLKLATDDSVWINPPERLIYCSPEAEEDPVARDTAEKLFFFRLFFRFQMVYESGTNVRTSTLTISRQ